MLSEKGVDRNAVFWRRIAGGNHDPDGKPAWHKNDFPALLALAEEQDWVILGGAILKADFSPAGVRWDINPERKRNYRDFRRSAVDFGIQAAREHLRMCTPEHLIVPELVSAMEAFVCRRAEP